MLLLRDGPAQKMTTGPATQSPITDAPKELLEKYELLEKVGEGGMGRVYKVRHRVLQRFDVCKLIHSRIFLNDEQKKKFIREALISSQLKKHKNLVAVYGAGGEEDTPYILFEFVKGVPLDKRIKELKRLPVKEALFYGKEICEGLSYAHSMGIVHRDMKSENVILSDQIVDGFPIPKIADFGIAKDKSAPKPKEESHKGQKQDWAIHGTPSYMSPEPAAGEEATEQSVIYSVGIILYEMLTGAVPFKGQSLHQVIMQHINEPPKPIHEINPEVPVQVSELVHKALEKDPKARYESAEDFAGKLERGLSFADKWAKGMTSGAGRLGGSGLQKRGATQSISSFPRAAAGGAVATTARFSLAGGGASGTANPTASSPPDLQSFVSEVGQRYRLQLILAAGAVVMLILFGLVKVLWPAGPTIDPSPKDQRVYQGLKDAVVTWKSVSPYVSVVEYGLDENQLTQERGAAAPEADHTVKLSNLKAGTKYYFRIVYPSNEKSLPYSFNMVEPDFRFWIGTQPDRGMRIEGETGVPSRAVLQFTQGAQAVKVNSQEGDAFETAHVFKAETMRPEDRIDKIHLTFPTGEEVDVAGDRVRVTK